MKSMFYNTAERAYRSPGSVTGARAFTHLVGKSRVKKVLLVVGDIVVLYVALLLALVIRHQAFPTYFEIKTIFWPFSALFGGWLLAFYIGDLYEIAVNKNEVKFYNRLLSVLWLNCGITAVYFYFASSALFDARPQTVFVIFGVSSCVLMAFWRYGYNCLLEQPTLQRNILVVGLNEGAYELIDEIVRRPQLGYRIAAVVHHDDAVGETIVPGVPVYDDRVNIRELMLEENISTVVAAFDPRTNVTLLQQLFNSLSLKVQFFELPTFYERLTGKILINSISHIWFLENLAQADKSFFEFFKRASDLVCALVLGILVLPFIPFIILAIKLDSKGSVLFFQTRAGLLGRPFRAIKFRTMRATAESDGIARWAQKNDPRITRIGRFLRKSRIDEVPQLLNVLKGEMSLIGPRPERPEFVKNLEKDIPFYNERHLVKPGITGWAQVRFRYGASVADSFKKLEYDFFYIKNRSIALDFAILLKTISIVLTGGGQ